MDRIKFTESEIALYTEVAEQRFRRSRGLGPGHGEVQSDSREYQRHLHGAAGELGFARLAGYQWPYDEDDFGASGDFPGGEEVRTTEYERGSLVVFDSDPRDRNFVLMVISLTWVPQARYAGFLPGSSVDSEGDRPGCRVRAGSKPQLWVPQDRLDSRFPIGDRS